jgi:hypothetical protein
MVGGTFEEWWGRDSLCCSTSISVLLFKKHLAISIFYQKLGAKMFPDLLLNAIFEPCTIHPVLFRWEEDTVTFEGIPYPPHFLENQSSEALVSLPSTQWNPCSCAYFGCISMFVIFSLETVSHTHVASVRSVIVLPARFPCPLCLERELRTWFSLGKWYKMWLLKWSFKSVFFLCVQSLFWWNLWLPSPETSRFEQ